MLPCGKDLQITFASVISHRRHNGIWTNMRWPIFGLSWSQNNTTINSTAATLNASTSFIPENCLNGKLVSGFCLCTDGWSGTTCNISNFCSEQWPFPKTVLGQFASSRELCEIGTPNAGLPKASALCNISTHTFDPQNTLKCDLTLDSIGADISKVSVTDKIMLASSAQIITSKPELLTPYNITKAVNIANVLLSNDNPLEFMSVAVSTVAMISQLLNASNGKFSDVNHEDLSKLTQTLQKFSLSERSNKLLVQPNLAVQSFKGGSDIQQVQLTLFKGSDTFMPDRIKLDSSNIPFQKEVSLQMNITFGKSDSAKVGFVLYDSDQFFQSQSFKSSQNTKRRVLSANLLESVSDVNEVNFAVTHEDPKMSIHNFACVFWSYSKKDWSTEDCTKTRSFSGRAQCSCTSKRPQNFNFAILMTLEMNYQYSEALNWISIIGCSLSIVGLAVTAVYQIATRKSRGCSPTVLLVNICLSMITFYLLFIFGINNPDRHAEVANFLTENIIPASDYIQYSDMGPCTMFTALIHYFLLATLTWNTLYGIHVFLLFKATISGAPRWFLKLSIAIGWGFPAIIVGISLGATYRVEDPLGYRQEEFCWLASFDKENKFDMRKPMFWGFLLPLVIMLMTNIAILLHFSNNICKTDPNLNSSRKTPLKKKILSSFSLAVMLGLSWVTGYILLFTHEKTFKLILSIVFCVCNTTQGIQIFILFTLRSVLNSNPAVLSSMNPPNIGIHRKTFFLWKEKVKESRETYTATNPDFAGMPQVISGNN